MNIQTENKLTNEEIGRVFAMYLGCEFSYEQEVCTVEGIYGNSVVYSEDADESGEGVYAIEDCKLLLTPLDKISDEHALDFAKMKMHKSVWTANVGKQRLMFELKEARMSDGYKYGPLDYVTYQQLILWGYDVPLHFGPNHWANGKTAVELGIAIEK